MPATLGFLIDNAGGLEAICEAPGCGHVGTLGVAGLAEWHGRGVTIDQLRPRLRCASCGGRQVRLEAFATRHGPIG
jgi:hypothetical protein